MDKKSLKQLSFLNPRQISERMAFKSHLFHTQHSHFKDWNINADISAVDTKLYPQKELLYISATTPKKVQLADLISNIRQNLQTCEHFVINRTKEQLVP